jgi:hypothetical protein
MSDFGFDADFDELVETLEDMQDEVGQSGTFFIGTAVEYAVYLEFGTSKMDPKPFFRPALAEARRDLSGFIRDNSRKTIEEIDSADELARTIAFALERRVKQIITEKGLIETGTLRASVSAVPDPGNLPSADEVDPDGSAAVEVSS